MNYFKYLDLNWQPSAVKLKQYIYDNEQDLLTGFHSSWKAVDTNDVISKVPELIDMVLPLGVTIRYVAFFISNYPVGTIHIDADTYSKVRINIPIINCEHTETRFYTTSAPLIRVLQQNGIPLFKIDPTKCTHVDQFYLTQAVLFRNTEPHQVISNNLVHPRISCTIGLNEDLSYLLE
jgi:hypothetical protein